MKKLLLTILILLFSLGLVQAGLTPLVLFGKVVINSEPFAFQEVKVTDVTIGVSQTLKTNENGVYLTELNNFKNELGRQGEIGDVIEVISCPVSINAGCKQTYTVTDAPKNIIFDVKGSDLISVGAIPVSEVPKLEPVPVIISEPVTKDCGAITCSSVTCGAVTCPSNTATVCPTVEDKICPINSDVENYIRWAIEVAILLLGIISTYIFAKYKWGKGFAGLINYNLGLAKEALNKKDYATAKKYVNTAVKSANTAAVNDAEGKYK
ncbi:hypothetical protein HYU06_07360 [Candidatus Woesearchaeota archaeon]|nr:hypothetical protein [Candidatus Woesearchaeota archaeon]